MSDFCYIGIWPACNCIRVVAADEPEYAKDNAKTIAKLIRAGYTIERVTVEKFKKGPKKFGCKFDRNELGTCPNPHANPRRKAA